MRFSNEETKQTAPHQFVSHLNLGLPRMNYMAHRSLSVASAEEALSLSDVLLFLIISLYRDINLVLLSLLVTILVRVYIVA